MRYIGTLLFFWYQPIIGILSKDYETSNIILAKDRHSNGISKKESVVDLERDDRRRKAIIGGELSIIDRYPYMVTVQYNYGNGHLHTCGGSLISPDIILTAAHCYSQYASPKVIIGDHDLTKKNDAGESFDTTLLEIHPDYDPDDKSYNHDIMLLKVLGNSTKTPVKINRQHDIPTHLETLVAIGWGSVDTDGSKASDILRETTLEYVDNFSCFKPPGILCAQDLDGTVDEDTCSGDSGGPIMIKGDDNEQDIQVGLTSAGPSPCAQPFPAFYTRLSEYRDWIRDNVCSSSSAAPKDFACNPNSLFPSFSLVPSTQPSITNSPSEYKVPFTLVIRFDRYPEDVNWEFNFANSDDHPLYVNENKYSPSLQYNFVYESIKLPPDREYSFTIYDKSSNGICCSVGTGYYFLYWGGEENHFDETKVMFWNLGEFQEMKRHYFRSSYSNISEVPKSKTQEYKQFITIEILFDMFPFEISWNITSEDRTILYSTKPPFSYLVSANQKVYDTVYLPAHQILKFDLADSLGDGLLYNGYVKVYEGNITENLILFQESGKFSFKTHTFKLTAPPSNSPSFQPSILNIPSNSPMALPTHYPSTSSLPTQLPSTDNKSFSDANRHISTGKLLQLVIIPSFSWMIFNFL